ncbi:MAG: hypothetical protein NTY64_01975 [Deltaproteobacteria bacterium]|nr:hypothetical protein [Deltaproteobacteria bacterium]
MKTFYMIFGTAVLLFLSIAEYRGWSLARYDEVQGVPRSLRDNPGSYRSHYAGMLHK